MKLMQNSTESTRAGIATGMASAVFAAMLTAPAGAEIYRCTEGDTTVFSDVPCSGTAEVHLSEGRVSVVRAAEDLDEVAASNKAFVEERRKELAQQHKRAARQQREALQQQRRREAIEQASRYRTVVGHLGHPHFGTSRELPVDPRNRSRQRRAADPDAPERRRTLLSRSGGNQRNILR